MAGQLQNRGVLNCLMGLQRHLLFAFVLLVTQILPTRGQDDANVQPHQKVSEDSPKRSRLTAVQLYAQTAPTVAALTIKNEAGKAIGSGSGFFIPATWVKERYSDYEMDEAFRDALKKEKSRIIQYGYVLTNYHVIKPALSVDVMLHGGSTGSVSRGLAEREQTDLALLAARIETSVAPKALTISSETPAVGADVYVIGSPLGLTNSLSQGIVSGIRESETDVTWLQTTAPLSAGSSGGPVLANDGAVVGIATATRRDGQKLNFAVPAALLEIPPAPTPPRPP